MPLKSNITLSPSFSEAELFHLLIRLCHDCLDFAKTLQEAEGAYRIVSAPDGSKLDIAFQEVHEFWGSDFDLDGSKVLFTTFGTLVHYYLYNNPRLIHKGWVIVDDIPVQYGTSLVRLRGDLGGFLGYANDIERVPGSDGGFPGDIECAWSEMEGIVIENNMGLGGGHNGQGGLSRGNRDERRGRISRGRSGRGGRGGREASLRGVGRGQFSQQVWPMLLRACCFQSVRLYSMYLAELIIS